MTRLFNLMSGHIELGSDYTNQRDGNQNKTPGTNSQAKRVEISMIKEETMELNKRGYLDHSRQDLRL